MVVGILGLSRKVQWEVERVDLNALGVRAGILQRLAVKSLHLCRGAVASEIWFDRNVPAQRAASKGESRYHARSKSHRDRQPCHGR